MNILLWGAGENYWIYKKWLSGHKVVAILDNAKNLWYKQIDGHEIVPPEDIAKYNYDRIYILSSYVAEIKRQLLALGIAENKIFYTYRLYDLGVQPAISCYSGANSEAQSSKAHVLVFSHELTLTGAPICLGYLVSILVRNGFQVTVVSPTDGALRQGFLDVGANVIVDELLLVSDDINRQYMKEYDVLFINTLQLFYLLKKRDLQKKTIWWLHEPDCLYKYLPDGELCSLNRYNLDIYAVSEVARKAFLKQSLYSVSQVGLLPFGIPDEKRKNINRRSLASNACITFIIVGGISKLKGHDILLKAMQILRSLSDYNGKYKVLSIGDNQNTLAKQIMSEVDDAELALEFKGRLSHDVTIGMLEESDVVICASREETMSAAIIEGMMLGKICITTDNTGIADYIVDGKNGFICNASDAQSLANKIMYIMENYTDLSFIQSKARETYEKYFSMTSFGHRVNEIFM